MSDNSIEKMRLVILQSDEEAAEESANYFTALQVDVTEICAGDLDAAANTVRDLRPDVVLLDSFLREQGGDTLQALQGGQQEAVLAVIAETCEDLPASETGDELVFAQPLDYRQIVDACRAALERCKEDYSVKWERYITDLLHRIGMPANLRGYGYIRDSVLFALKDRTILDSITKGLYPAVAEKHNTLPGRVERSMRNAVESTWRQGNLETLNSLFGHMVSAESGKPSNGELVAILTEHILQNAG